MKNNKRKGDIMNGVEILSTAGLTNIECTIFVIIGMITALVGFIVLFVDQKPLGFLAVAFGIILIVSAVQYTPGKEYKVTVSDEVSFDDFMEKYEIVDQEGSIYTVRERE